MSALGNDVEKSYHSLPFSRQLCMKKNWEKKVLFLFSFGMNNVNVFSNHRAHSWQRLRSWIKYQRKSRPAKQALVKNSSSVWINGQKATRTPNRLITFGESLDKNAHCIHLIHCTQRNKRGWALDTFWPRAVIPRRLTVHRRIIIVQPFGDYLVSVGRFSDFHYLWGLCEILRQSTCNGSFRWHVIPSLSVYRKLLRHTFSEGFILCLFTARRLLG